LTAELWQFAALIGVFFVAAVLWLCIIYLPARTMEYSEARRMEARDRDPGAPGSSG
jgi:Na+/H+-dicarboxylate symporter